MSLLLVETTAGNKPLKPISVNTDKLHPKAISANDLPDEELKDELGVPSSKRMKDELAQSVQLKPSSLNRITPSSAEKTGGSNVFARLTTKKSLTVGPKKKAEKEKIVVNFFDKQYKTVLKGRISMIILLKNERFY